MGEKAAGAVRTDSDAAMFKNMTYDDYLSAVYTYDEIADKCMKASANADRARVALKNAEKDFEAAEKDLRKSQDTYESIIGKEASKRQELWNKNQARFDFKIANKRAAAEQAAKNDIQNKKDEYASSVQTAYEQEKTLTQHLKELDDSYSDFLEQQKNFANCTARSFPPADANALAMLKRARRKNLLTKFQNEMLEGDVNTICDSWISGFDELISTQNDFVKTQFYDDILNGTVTDEIVQEVTNTTTIVFTAVLMIILLILSVFSPSAYEAILRIAASCAAWGGSTASVTHIVRNRLPAFKNLPFNRKAIFLTAFFMGCIPGYIIAAALTAQSNSPGALIYSLITAVGSGLLFRRLMRTAPAKNMLSKIPRLKDRARKNVFSDYEMLENGKYNFMIFCYLKHESILTYLSMLYTQGEIDSLQERINFNRKDHKYYTEQLEAAKKRIADMKNGAAEVSRYEAQRNKELHDELEAIEKERPPKPDFREEAIKALGDSLDELKEQIAEQTRLYDEKQGSLETARLENEKLAKSLAELKKQKKRVSEALRQWKQTPLPSSTDYKLLDTLCLDSKTNITIINHDLEPCVLYYLPKNRSTDPGEILSNFIYRCVRGLCKINPRRLMQINIFDYVSDDKYLLNERLFTKLSDRGVISGIYSMKDFEIRLFSNNEGYRTFKDFFKLSCSRIGTVINENRDKIPEGVKPDIALANRIQSGELFPYQVCIFIVPRENDNASFPPPKGILELVNRGSYVRLGLFPLFIADSESVAKEWQPILESYRSCEHIFPL